MVVNDSTSEDAEQESLLGHQTPQRVECHPDHEIGTTVTNATQISGQHVDRAPQLTTRPDTGARHPHCGEPDGFRKFQEGERKAEGGEESVKNLLIG